MYPIHPAHGNSSIGKSIREVITLNRKIQPAALTAIDFQYLTIPGKEETPLLPRKIRAKRIAVLIGW